MSASGDEKKPRRPKRTRAYRVSAQRLQALRAARGWSQHEASERAGVSDRSLRKAEAGGPLELKTIALLAELYSTPDAPLTPQDLLPQPAEAVEGQATRYERLVRRWFDEVWTAGRLETIDELASSTCAYHAAGAVLRGRAKIRQQIAAMRADAEQIEIRIEQVIVAGDWVASRWRLVPVRRPRAAGMPATRRRGALPGSTWMRITDGLFIEVWAYWPPHSVNQP